MNSAKLVIIILILFVIFAAIDLKRRKAGEKYASELAEALQKEDYETFDKLSQSSAVLRTVSGYNLSVMQFNEAIMKNQPERAASIFDALMQTRLNEQQLASLLVSAVGWFAVQHDEKHLKQIQKKASSLKNAQITEMISAAEKASNDYPDLTLEQLTSILQKHSER